jgi:large subunit ribosomal protein L16
MFLQPKKTKYKKIKKGRQLKLNFKGNKLNFGNIGLKSTESGLITSRQLESARQSINRKLKRKGKIWIRVFPSLPITTKPTEVRMGKGKGSVSHWGVKVAPGSIIFEIVNKNFYDSIKALNSGKHKLPVKTKIIKN